MCLSYPVRHRKIQWKHHTPPLASLCRSDNVAVYASMFGLSVSSVTTARCMTAWALSPHCVSECIHSETKTHVKPQPAASVCWALVTSQIMCWSDILQTVLRFLSTAVQSEQCSIICNLWSFPAGLLILGKQIFFDTSTSYACQHLPF